MSYSEEESQIERQKKVGDYVNSSFRMCGAAGQKGCRFCGEQERNPTNNHFKCGYYGLSLGGKIHIQSLCSNFHTQNITNNQVKVTSSHPCGCDIIQLMKTGCICGGY